MSLRADEVAFLSGAPFTDSLDNNGDNDNSGNGGRGRRFSSYGTNNYGNSHASSSSSFSKEQAAAASGFVALSQVVDVPLDQALGPQLDIVRRSSGAVGGAGGRLSLAAGGGGGGGGRGKRGSVVGGGTGSSGFVLLTVTQASIVSFFFNAPITPRTHKRLSPFVSVRIFVSSSLITCVYFSPTSFLLFHFLHFLVR